MGINFFNPFSINSSKTSQKNSETGKELLKLGERVSLISAALTLFIALIKLGAGYVSGSVVVIADAIHSFSDVVGPLTVYFGLKLSQKEPNEKFPYGYYKAETLASLVVSLLIILSGVEILRESIQKLIHPEKISYPFLAILSLIISLVITTFLAYYKNKAGKKIGSQALIGEGAHSIVDSLTSIIALLGIIFALLGYPIIEPLCGAGISLFVIFLGLKFLKKDLLTFLDFYDEELKNLAQKIEGFVLKLPGVEGLHHLKLRKAGPFIYCEMHIEVDENLSFREAHEISDQVEKEIKRFFKQIAGITIHIDPVKKKKILLVFPVGNLKKEKLLASEISSLGNAKFFLFLLLNEGHIEKIWFEENKFKSLERKKALKIGEFFREKDVDWVIAREIGEGLKHVLTAKFIKFFITQKFIIKEALEDFLEFYKLSD